MCGSCYDAEEFAKKVMNNELCTGEDMITMSYDSLKYNLTQEWLKSSKSEFYIFRKAIEDAPESLDTQFAVSHKNHDGKIRRQSLCVHFI